MTSTLLQLPETQALRTLSPDGRLLFGARLVRMFAFGFLSIVLVLYLTELGLNEREVGLLFSGTFLGDTVISLWITGVADRMGRRRMLLLGTGLMILTGLIFALTGNILLLTIAAIIGTMSPNGAEAGPFLSIEQAALPQTTSGEYRTTVFAWYNLIAMLAKAMGALGGGVIAQALQNNGMSPLESYRVMVVVYALLGLGLIYFFMSLSPAVEVTKPAMNTRIGLHRSRGIVFKLAGLFMVDSFAGGLILQSLVAYWFFVRFQTDLAVLGGIFFGVNLLSGFSSLVAARVASRFGLINTMVFTHIPANILLISMPLMPTLELAVLVLLVRSLISQMDVPTRQSYTMAVVEPDERSAAAGITTIARSVGSSISPLITGTLFHLSLFSLPFFLAGGLKIAYDLSLYYSFRALKPPEEQKENQS